MRRLPPDQARIDVELDRIIRQTNLAGGIVFAWLDEWFKRNWMYFDLERPAINTPQWLNTLDAEEHYGPIATDPQGDPPLCSAEAKAMPAVPGAPGLLGEATPAGVQLAWKTEGQTRVLLFDVHPTAGDECRVTLKGTKGQLLVNSGYRPFKPQVVGKQTYRLYDPHATPVPVAPLVPYVTLPNIRRLGRDGTVYPAETDEPGQLRGGGAEDPASRDLTEDFCTAGGWTHLSVPWTPLNVTDPSSHQVQDGRPSADRQDHTLRIEGIGGCVHSEVLASPAHAGMTQPTVIRCLRP
ncbi:hypothetical protein [Deinococcus sonorensis]|uniref:Uncharacterized protein n=2 Tax=Deinococcus sonorensis TaxID=309891 RepID=A0AAU7U6W8_9DEIO